MGSAHVYTLDQSHQYILSAFYKPTNEYKGLTGSVACYTETPCGVLMSLKFFMKSSLFLFTFHFETHAYLYIGFLCQEFFLELLSLRKVLSENIRLTIFVNYIM